MRGVKGLYWSLDDYERAVEELPVPEFNELLVCYTAVPELSLWWQRPLRPDDRSRLRQLVERGARRGIAVDIAVNPVVAAEAMRPSTSGLAFHPLVRDSSWFRDFFAEELRRTGRLAAGEGFASTDVNPPIRYGDAAHVRLLTDKVNDLQALGFRRVALCLDDVDPGLSPADQERFGDLGTAHAALAAAVLDAMRAGDPFASLLVCPTHYTSASLRENGEYAARLRELLPADIGCYWTGPEVVSEAVTERDAREAQELLGRKPVLWLNYPCNDFVHQKLHLAPFCPSGDPVWRHLAGVVVNPMVQQATSAVLLRAIGEYLAAPAGYAPDTALRTAIHATVGADDAPALERIFAEYARGFPDIDAMDADAFSAAELDRLQHTLGALEEALADLTRNRPDDGLARELEEGVRRLALYVEVYEVLLGAAAAVAGGARDGREQALARLDDVGRLASGLAGLPLRVTADASYLVTVAAEWGSALRSTQPWCTANEKDNE
jgi:hypothetical protein